MTLLSSPPSLVISDSPAAPLMICLTCRPRISDSDFCQIFGFSLKSSRIIASQRISVYSSVMLDCPRLLNYALFINCWFILPLYLLRCNFRSIVDRQQLSVHLAHSQRLCPNVKNVKIKQWNASKWDGCFIATPRGPRCNVWPQYVNFQFGVFRDSFHLLIVWNLYRSRIPNWRIEAATSLVVGTFIVASRPS